MKKNKQLVPKRRFKEFEVAAGWKEYKLGDNSKITTGGTPSTKYSEYWNPKEIPWMSSGEVNKKRLGTTDNSISKKGFENSSATWVEKNSILMALAGQGKTRGTVAINKIPLTTNQSIAAITPYSKIDAEFLYHNLDNRYEELRLKSSGDGTRGGLNKQIISELHIFAPNIDEQTRIGNFFQKVDKLIEYQQLKIKKTKKIKKSYLSDLFPKEGEKYPKKRFEGFTESWEEYRLEELSNIVRGASPRPIKDPKWFDSNSDVGWLRISDVTAQDGRIHYLEQKMSKAGQDKTRVLKTPHLLLSIAATVGKPVINYVHTGVHDGFLIFMEPNFEQEFMYQWLEMFRVKWQKYGQPGSQVNLNSDIVKNQNVMIPSEEEQIKIANFFKNLDKQINLEEQKLNKLEQLKQAYLTELFV